MDFDTRAVHHAITRTLKLLELDRDDTPSDTLKDAAGDVLKMLARRMVDGTLKVTLDGPIDMSDIP